MYAEYYSKYLKRKIRVYGPHVYIYEPDQVNTHKINGWVPTQVPFNKVKNNE